MDEPTRLQWVSRRLQALDDQLGVEPEGEKDERWIDCPNCGAEAHRKKCSYSPRGWNCFICQEHGGLKDLTERLGTPRPTEPYREPVKRKAKVTHRPHFWQQHAEETLSAFTNHPKTQKLWNDYVPFTLDTIQAWSLGVGVLPSCSCRHDRLIYPCYDAMGRIVAFRGRVLKVGGCGCEQKWHQAAGSRVTLWGGSLIPYEENAIVIVCESPVDAMFAMQETPRVIAVASTGGAGTWRDSWTKWIVSQKPGRVIVWYDNDLHGTPNEKLLSKLAEKWFLDHPKAKKLPRANGPRVANLLRKAGANAVLYKWPDDAPEKADLSWALMEGRT